MILKIVASLFIFTGSLGYGVCLIRENIFHISQLKMQRKILMMMQNEIMYFHRDFSDTCKTVASKCTEPYATFLNEISMQINAWKGESLQQIWKKEIDKVFEKEKRENYMEVFIKLPEELTCQESDMQIQTINYAKEMIEEKIRYGKKQYEQNRKMILWLSGIGGLVCIVLLT